MFSQTRQQSSPLSSASQRHQRGQGVIEYAGALVIAAVLVAASLFIVPDEVASMINVITTTAIDFLVGAMPEA